MGLAFVMKRYKGFVASLPKTPEELEKEAFVSLCKEGQTPGSDAAKTLYFFHWKAFQAADAVRDGKVSAGEFDLMINYLIDTPLLPSMSPRTNGINSRISRPRPLDSPWLRLLLVLFNSTTNTVVSMLVIGTHTRTLPLFLIL